MIVHVGRQDPQQKLKLGNGVTVWDQNQRQHRRPAKAHDKVDRMIVLGGERRVDLVFVMNLVVFVQTCVSVHHAVCHVKAKFLDECHGQYVPNVLFRAGPVFVAGSKEKGLVRLENLVFDMDFQSHQNGYQQEQIDCYEP